MTTRSQPVAPAHATASGTTTPGLPHACQGCRLRGAALCHAMMAAGTARHRGPVSRTLARGRPFFEQGARPGLVGVIRTGYARKSMIRPSGQRVLLGLALPGDIIGRPPGHVTTFDLEAATDVEVCLHDSAGLGSAFQADGAVLELMLRETDEIHQRALGNLWRYGTLNSRERIVAFMVSATAFMPTEPLPDGSLLLTMAIDRRDWADLTNTAVETISRTLRYLEEKDLVKCLTPYRFRIRDLDCLALLAGVDVPGHAERTGRSVHPPVSGNRMTAVNDCVRRAPSIKATKRPLPALSRGVSEGRQRHVEEIRSRSAQGETTVDDR